MFTRGKKPCMDRTGAGGAVFMNAHVIARLRQKANELRALINAPNSHMNEQNTKASLIEPILRELGWNVEDPQEVCREYKSPDVGEAVDYGLLVRGKPVALVEAKALGTNLKGHTSQILSYGAMTGVNWCVLTDGDEYRLYNVHAPVPASEKLFRSFKLSKQEAEQESAEALCLLTKESLTEGTTDRVWRAEFSIRRVQDTLRRLLQEKDSRLVELLSSELPDFSGEEIENSFSRLEINAIKCATKTAHSKTSVLGAPHKPVKMIDLIEAGLVQPPMEIQTHYKGQVFKARVLPTGKIEYQGKEYGSPSGASDVVFGRAGTPGNGGYIKIRAQAN